MKPGELARLTWAGLPGALVLGPDLTWHALGDDAGLVALEAVANARAAGYRYSPSDGAPGCRLATETAQALHGQAELPPVPPHDPEVLH